MILEQVQTYPQKLEKLWVIQFSETPKNLAYQHASMNVKLLKKKRKMAFSTEDRLAYLLLLI